MSRMLIFALMVLVSGIGFAQTAEEYCATEKAEGENCYMNCCTSMGYTWSGGGCELTDSEYAYVSEQCGYCTESFIQCRDYYEGVLASGGSSGYSSGSTSSSGGCCSGFALLAALTGLFAFRK